MAVFPSEEWTKLYVDAVNSSAAYKEAAAGWEGDLSYLFQAEPDKGVPEDIYGWFDLWHGECRQYTYNAPKEEAERAKFILSAPYSRWKEVIKGDLDPIKGMMQGKLKLKGSLPTMVRYVKASNELVALAASIPTEFIDEQ